MVKDIHLYVLRAGEHGEKDMKHKIFVGGLHWKTTEPDLKSFFSLLAPVKFVRIILDRETGRSKCFGFVEFSEDVDIDDIIAQSSGKKLEGRFLKVSAAREREAKKPELPVQDVPPEVLNNGVSCEGQTAQCE